MSKPQLKSKSFKEVIDKSIEVSEQFPTKYDVRDHFMDLVEEVGELSQALQISSGRKVTNDLNKQRNKEDVIDAICDSMFELIRLAHKLDIDLEGEYLKVMDHLQSRLDSGEFKTNNREVEDEK